jgi:beta-lactamase class A
LGEDTAVAAASTFKVQVALELFRQVATGETLADEMVIVPTQGRTPGPTGISLFRQELRLSLADLACLMLTISDNAATDLLIARVGLGRIQALGKRVGMSATSIPGDVSWMLETLAVDCGFSSLLTM